MASWILFLTSTEACVNNREGKVMETNRNPCIAVENISTVLLRIEQYHVLPISWKVMNIPFGCTVIIQKNITLFLKIDCFENILMLFVCDSC